ncbi:MAG: sigma-70 family RNA polymerase sigma factor [Spirochaetales bacterium]|nr:sigma-70 family RNA polymerase sigma factor [Spirochaetales bacterium]
MKKTSLSGGIVSDTDNSLSIYLKEINKVSLLTREEEQKYARLAAAGNKAAKEKLIAANLRFVVNVAKKYQNQGLALDDLISEGNIGLINAIERFDVDKGYHFISYAVWWIRQSILKAICEKSRTIRLPLNRANELVQIEKYRKELFADRGLEASDQEIATALGMDKGMVRELMDISREMVSLESPVYTDKDTSVLSDFLEDKDFSAPEEITINTALKKDINEALTTLSAKESTILEFRFGLNEKKPLSLKEIGEKFQLTKERIRQIEKKALQKLQTPSLERELEAYMVN